MKTLHTDGPWKVRKEWSGDGYEVYPTRGGKKPEFGQWAAIATVDSIVSKGESARKNARLIAAAPELLHALKLADAMLSGANMNAKMVEQKVRAAIAKATGGAK
jgi:hypothetical protein